MEKTKYNTPYIKGDKIISNDNVYSMNINTFEKIVTSGKTFATWSDAFYYWQKMHNKDNYVISESDYGDYIIEPLNE